MDSMKGKVWTFRDCIDTDVIIAGRYLRTFNPEDLAAHVMEAEDPEFSSKVGKGDIIVGANFHQDFRSALKGQDGSESIVHFLVSDIGK